MNSHFNFTVMVQSFKFMLMIVTIKDYTSCIILTGKED